MEIGTRARVRQRCRSIRQVKPYTTTTKWNKHTNRIKWMWQHVIMIYIFFLSFVMHCLARRASFLRCVSSIVVSPYVEYILFSLYTALFSSIHIYVCLCCSIQSVGWQWHFVPDFHSSSLLCAHSHRSPRFDAMKHESRTRKIEEKEEEVGEEQTEVFEWMTVFVKASPVPLIQTKEEKRKNSILIQKRFLVPANLLSLPIFARS